MNSQLDKNFLSCDLTNSIIGILFICLIVACAGILILAVLTAMSLPVADATKWHDGSILVRVNHH